MLCKLLTNFKILDYPACCAHSGNYMRACATSKARQFLEFSAQFSFKLPGKMQNMAEMLLLEGPNLNLVGQREPHLYGNTSSQEIYAQLARSAAQLSHNLYFFQSNHEGALIDYLQATNTANFNFIIVNAGGLTHTSIVLRDALLALKTPFIEAHLSNIFSRELFRQHSYLADHAVGVICGFGAQSYQLALQAADYYLKFSKQM